VPGLQIRRRWLTVEAIAWISAVVLLTYAGARYFDGVVGRRQAMRDFVQQHTSDDQPPPSELRTSEPADMSLWSPQRVKAWQAAVILPRPAPLAVLRIPKIHLEVPVLEGTDDVTLDRALGHIEQTAALGAVGNAGIAGHRDGYFRGLKDIVPGDLIELDTGRGVDRYRIDRTWIVTPDDVSVLDPTPERTLTLVTCYPFYFIGSAPQRFIVRATSLTSP